MFFPNSVYFVKKVLAPQMPNVLAGEILETVGSLAGLRTDSFNDAAEAYRVLVKVKDKLGQHFPLLADCWSQLEMEIRNDTRMCFADTHRQARIGIDFGYVISLPRKKYERLKKYEDLQPMKIHQDPKYWRRKLVPRVLKSVRRLVRLVGARNVFIVSKCHVDAESPIIDYLWHKNFFRITGFDEDNIYFCRRREDKAEIARQLGLTHLIDDRIEVLVNANGVVNFLFALNPRADDLGEKAFFEKIAQHGSVPDFSSVIKVCATWPEVIKGVEKTFPELVIS